MNQCVRSQYAEGLALLGDMGLLLLVFEGASDFKQCYCCKKNCLLYGRIREECACGR